VAELTAWGDFTAAPVDSFRVSSSKLEQKASGRIERAFLEAGEGGFRILVVNEDDSAMMLGRGGLEWVREEALAAVDQVGDEQCCCRMEGRGAGGGLVDSSFSVAMPLFLHVCVDSKGWEMSRWCRRQAAGLVFRFTRIRHGRTA